MDQQQQQQINQLKVIALQSAQGDITRAMDIFNWLSMDYQTDVIDRYKASTTSFVGAGTPIAAGGQA